MIALLLVAACTGRTDAPVAVAGDSLATVRLPAFDSISVPEWTSEVVFSTVGQSALELGIGHSVRAAFSRDTTLFISNQSSIVVLQPDGVFLRVAGRNGEGPGEFREILSLGINGDGGIFASELESGRLTSLAVQGGVLRLIPRVAGYPVGRKNEVVTVLDGGRSVSVPWQGRPAVDVDSGFVDGLFRRERVILSVQDTLGQFSDSLGAWPGFQRIAGLPIRFARGVVFDGRVNNTIIGSTDSIDLTLFEGTRPRRRFVGPATNRNITPADIAAWRDSVTSQMPTEAPFLIKFNGEAKLPTTLPTVGGVALSERTEIWIGEYVTPRDSLRRWHIYSLLGVPLGTIQLPALTAAFLPVGTELLDVAHGRVALLRQMKDGELVVEVRRVRAP